MSVQVTVIARALDAFGASGSVAGLPSTFFVWIGRNVALRLGDVVVAHGTTDRVTFTANRVTQLDGTPIP